MTTRGTGSAAPRRVAAITTALGGALSLLSAVTPDVPWRRHLLLAVEPGPLMALGHVLPTVGGVALLYVRWGILRGRRRRVDPRRLGHPEGTAAGSERRDRGPRRTRAAARREGRRLRGGGARARP